MTCDVNNIGLEIRLIKLLQHGLCLSLILSTGFELKKKHSFIFLIIFLIKQLHDLQPGDWIVVKDYRRRTWNSPRWLGPFQVLLITSSAVKVAERATWIHASHCRRAPPLTPTVISDPTGSWEGHLDLRQPLQRGTTTHANGHFRPNPLGRHPNTETGWSAVHSSSHIYNHVRSRPRNFLWPGEGRGQNRHQATWTPEPDDDNPFRGSDGGSEESFVVLLF